MTAATAAASAANYMGSFQQPLPPPPPPCLSSSASCRALNRPAFLLSSSNGGPRARHQLLCAHKRFLHALAGAIARTQHHHSKSSSSSGGRGSGASGASSSLGSSPTIALAVSHGAFIRTIATGTAATREYGASSPAQQPSAAAAAGAAGGGGGGRGAGGISNGTTTNTTTTTTNITGTTNGSHPPFRVFTAQDLARLLRAGNASGGTATNPVNATHTHMMLQRASAAAATATGRRRHQTTTAASAVAATTTTGRRHAAVDFDRVLAAIDRAVRSIIAVAKDVLGNPWVDLSLLAAALTAMSWYYIRRLGTSAAAAAAAATAAAAEMPTRSATPTETLKDTAASSTPPESLADDEIGSIRTTTDEDIEDEYETSFSMAAQSSDFGSDLYDDNVDKVMYAELSARAERLARALERAIAQAAQLDGTVAAQQTLIARLEDENRILLQKLDAALRSGDSAFKIANADNISVSAQNGLAASATAATANASSAPLPSSGLASTAPTASIAPADAAVTAAPMAGPRPGFLTAAQHLTPELRPRSPGLLSDSGWDDLTDVLLSAAMPQQ
ncbi:hypothetical protein HDU86_005013 [Geranomyces michiganensis]|nr:hypothetical protein HDU86_005013 [Geranomyces michiganensis]